MKFAILKKFIIPSYSSKSCLFNFNSFSCTKQIEGKINRIIINLL